MVKKIILMGFLSSFFLLNMISCNSYNNTEISNEHQATIKELNHSEKNKFIKGSEIDVKLNGNIQFIGYSSNEVIYRDLSKSTREILCQDIETLETRKFTSVKDEKNDIFEITKNKDWIIWSENKDTSIGEGTNSKGLNWIISAKNLKTNEEFLIDKANITEADVDLEKKAYYGPINIQSKGDLVVYRVGDINENNEFITKVMAFDLKNKELIEIEKGDTTQNELLAQPYTNGQDVFWVHSENYTDSGRYFYKENYIMKYDIINRKKEKLKLPIDNMINRFVVDDKGNLYLSVGIGVEIDNLDDELIAYYPNTNEILKIKFGEGTHCNNLKISNTHLFWNNKDSKNFEAFNIETQKIENILDENILNSSSICSYEVYDNILYKYYEKDNQIIDEYFLLD